ncbi:MAG: recombination factor protein RarA [Gammaproteobacteria bacterium RIFCSPHIGHO2_12_FULL_43_28]|nr:MAG: recombination factor protein RarA [Gammaproteobacteria bacterium RIFCSPHIGHO2_12_FULL_43_28]
MKQESDKRNTAAYQPLATRMRPQSLQEYSGQAHLLAEGKPLRRAILQGVLHSMILWGPPGTGKTTLAELMAAKANAHFERLSAISSGVKDIRRLVDEAKAMRANENRATILFVDEVHRFNKAQQDVFLPFVEDGTFILIGATTENPSFELNSALLSRARVYVLKRLDEAVLLEIIEAALSNKERGLGQLAIEFPLPLRRILVTAADGDARQALNLLEIVADMAQAKEDKLLVTEALLAEVLQVSLRRFDKNGEAFYDQISALHKAVRGSSPDAALYWLCRMFDGGCDPRYLARRVIRMACEDIGLADPRALQLALNAADVYERLGSPEGELAIAEAVIYLATTSKSNAVYTAFGAAMRAAQQSGSLEVPLHLRNAPTKLMKELGYAKHYRYAHDEVNAYAAGENYFPEKLKDHAYYQPTARGLETKIAERLNYLRELDKKAGSA